MLCLNKQAAGKQSLTAKKLPASCVCVLLLLSSLHATASELHYQVEPKPMISNLPRVGLNLGEWTAWGASQFASNVLKNPGFEGIIDRAIVIVQDANQFGFSDNNVWTGRADGFWTGADYEVRSGASVGIRGKIAFSVAKGSQGFPKFKVSGKAPALKTGDVISLTLINDQALPTQWWFSKDSLPGQFSVVQQNLSPDTQGKRALALNLMSGKPATVFSYLDTIGARAGKLLPINGLWKLRFLAKKTTPDAKLTVRFRRLNQQKIFFQETFPLSQDWQVIERTFSAEDIGSAANLELGFTAEGTGSVVLDDVALGAVTKTSHPFRPELIAALKRLQPGYLRDWQGQLGDTFNNRLAGNFARRASRYHPGQESTFSYGLPEFLQLAHQVGAQPWVTLPSTMGDEEWRQMGRYLAKQINTLGFSELIVEFGNENWNPLFRAAGITDSVTHAAVANRAFELLKQGAGNHPKLLTVVNSQYANPWITGKTIETASQAGAAAVAPYFLHKLEQDDNGQEKLFEQDNLYAEHLTKTKAQAKQLLVYEVNLHTTGGTADAVTRNKIVNSAAAGAALAKRLLTGMDYGISKQMVYNMAQYDAYTDAPQEPKPLVDLWGIAHDLSEGTAHLRATGLAMAMLNTLLPADKYAVNNLETADNKLSINAFHNVKGWSLAIVSSKAEAQSIKVQFPPSAQRKWLLQQLSAPLDAAAKDIRIKEQSLSSKDNTISVNVPPYSFLVLLSP